METEGTSALKEQGHKNGEYTYADYLSWDLDPRERYEIIHGYAYRMNFSSDPKSMAAPSALHQAAIGELYRQIATYLKGKKCRVYFAPYDVRLFAKDEADEEDKTVVQPDITVVCDEAKRHKSGCIGAPDFVAEILSPSNTMAEMDRKYDLYKEAGVREYWVLDPDTKRLRVHLFEGADVITRTFKNSGSVKVEIFDGLFIDLEAVFAE